MKLSCYHWGAGWLRPSLFRVCLLAGLLFLTQVACNAKVTPTPGPQVTPTPAVHTPPVDLHTKATPTPTPTPAVHTPPVDLHIQQGGLPVQVQMGELTLGPGETGRVALLATGVTDADGVGGFDLQVKYDPTVVNVVGVLAGDAAFTTSTAYIIANPDNTAGVLRMVGIQPKIPGPIGEVALAYLEVKAVGSSGAASPLDLHINGFVDSQGFFILTQAVAGKVSIH